MAVRRRVDAAPRRRPARRTGTGTRRGARAGAGAAGRAARPRPIALPLEPDFDLGRLAGALRPRPRREFRVQVRRPDDLLVFDLLVENLELKTDSSPRLERKDPSAASYLIVEFPPQSFAEEAFLQQALDPSSGTSTDFVPGKEVSADPAYPKKNAPQPGEPVPPLPSARVRMAGRTRLAFAMPAGETALPYTLAAVLQAMRTWPLQLDVGALPDPERAFVRPGLVEATTLGEWLTLAVASPGWQTARAGLVEALERTGARGIAPVLDTAARRIAEQTAGGLAGGARESLGKVMFEVMHGEIAALRRRFAVLREGPAHQAGIAALSLAAAEALASAASRVGADIGVVTEIPWLPLLLAPHEPGPTATALELPYRLILSPIENARWLHRDLPVTRRGRTELWHTRLTAAPHDFGPDGASKVRALWSPDYPMADDDIFAILAPPPRPFRTSLDALDRKMLVKLMAGYNEARPGGTPYRPRPSLARRLHLSALGGLLEAEGDWNPRPAGVDLEQWRHLATLGRDHYVRVVYAGFLCPFGHAASLVKVTERKFESLGGDRQKRIAVLRQRFFLVVRERTKRYAGAGHTFGGRNFPFTQVEVITQVTPDLLEPGVGPSRLDAAGVYGGAVTPRMVFWPMVPAAAGPGGADVRFEIVATDLTGRRISFSMPLLFVGEVANAQRSGPIRNGYNAAGPARQRADLGSATVCYAPIDPSDNGDSRLPTDSMTFAAGALTAVHALRPNFYPETAAARVGVPALQKLLGRRDALVDVAYPGVYKDHGFGEADPAKNAGKVFLQLIHQVHRLEFGGAAGQAKSDVLGALAAPQMAIQGLSKIVGPVAAAPPADPTDASQIEAALAAVIGGTFDPADFFAGATILGGIELAKILETVHGLAGTDVPKLLSRQLPDRVETSFTWETEVKKSDPLNLLIPRADPAKPHTKLVMHSVVETPLQNPGAATYEARADLNNFKVNLFGFIVVWFEALRFVAKKGQKPDVTVDLRGGSDAVQFGGPLEFVNTLREFIPSNGFSDPPALAVTPSGISASYSLNLPAVQVGVFALSNASLGAGFSLPFDARPASVQFRFSEREHPFSLTVSLLGGGGFFAIGVSARGVQEIEAALEFGAAVALDLGVASGGVEIKAGVYYHWLEPQPNKGSVELAGYVRLHGELSVLGLISASLTFNLQLAYLKESGGSIVWGEATLVIEVEVLFFSADVSVRCRKEFAGASSDPKFIDLVPSQAIWTEYCEAFAEEAA